MGNIAALGMFRRPLLLILLIKFRLIPIRSQDKPRNPVRSSSHLLTDGVERYIRAALDDKFIVDMTDDKAVGECPDGMHQDISADCLDDVFNEFRTVGFNAFPLLRSTDTFVGYGFTAEFIFTNLWFDVGEAPAGGKLNEEHAALILEYDAFYSCPGAFFDSCFYCPINVPPETENIRI